jgi:hypothetical protein
VQRGDGLAGTGPAPHDQDAVGRLADDAVLLGPEGRGGLGDGARAELLERGDDDLADDGAVVAAGADVGGSAVGDLVVDGDDLAAADGDDALERDAGRIGGAGLVERAGLGRVPGDDDGVAGVVADVEAAHVARAAGVVDPAEDQRPVRRVVTEEGVGAVEPLLLVVESRVCRHVCPSSPRCAGFDVDSWRPTPRNLPRRCGI